jgi:hypothetical protein
MGPGGRAPVDGTAGEKLVAAAVAETAGFLGSRQAQTVFAAACNPADPDCPLGPDLDYLACSRREDSTSREPLDCPCTNGGFVLHREAVGGQPSACMPGGAGSAGVRQYRVGCGRRCPKNPSVLELLPAESCCAHHGSGRGTKDPAGAAHRGVLTSDSPARGVFGVRVGLGARCRIGDSGVSYGRVRWRLRRRRVGHRIGGRVSNRLRRRSRCRFGRGLRPRVSHRQPWPCQVFPRLPWKHPQFPLPGPAVEGWHQRRGRERTRVVRPPGSGAGQPQVLVFSRSILHRHNRFARAGLARGFGEVFCRHFSRFPCLDGFGDQGVALDSRADGDRNGHCVPLGFVR